MKSKDDLLQAIKYIKYDNIQNENRKQHFENKKEFDRVEEYERMIKTNNTKLEVLYWMLEE